MSNCLTLKKSNCKNCYKCIRHCPVKSIRFSSNQANIIGNECILCGKCFVVCPQDAKAIVDDTERVKQMLHSGADVVVSLAPSFAVNYQGAGINSMREALMKLGFADVEETAIGATIVKNEYERILAEEKRDVLISSCCHSVNLLVQKYFPKVLPCLADVVSPMQAHCADIKRRRPGALTVFIGPCVAKKDEAAHYGEPVDAVLTYEELSRWLAEENIEIEQIPDECEESRARLFPTSGGVLKTMSQDQPGYTYLVVDGVEECMAVLRDIEEGKIHNCFIEMSACRGSCINGPVIERAERSPVLGYTIISDYAGSKDFKVDQPDMVDLKKMFVPIEKHLQLPSEQEITDILHQMGKFKPEDELNCGSCGYDTCREKAIAIIHGKAEVSMCLPYLKNKAESFSDNIVKSTPNGIVVLNEKLDVQQINDAAKRLLNIRSSAHVLGEPVARIMDPTVFVKVLETRRTVVEQKHYFPEYDKYFEMTLSYDPENRLIICIMRDVSEQEREREKKESVSRQTIEVADKVVEKQMRIVQEIASLLGETAAETKIALAKLKESISNE